MKRQKEPRRKTDGRYLPPKHRRMVKCPNFKRVKGESRYTSNLCTYVRDNWCELMDLTCTYWEGK